MTPDFCPDTFKGEGKAGKMWTTELGWIARHMTLLQFKVWRDIPKPRKAAMVARLEKKSAINANNRTKKKDPSVQGTKSFASHLFDKAMYGERAKFLEGVQEIGDLTALSLSQTEEQMLETIQTQQMEIDSLNLESFAKSMFSQYQPPSFGGTFPSE
ncbi:hypothetical protein TIFTF001_006804 [Ficus carica]|uniref:Uncharacterized protein n=1 Tax=Ficus carica TaxID=3494 RepID=A0AA88D063_FICCA|nr:hypothetical protein TIFTF001_006804 [Ficus carica]